MERWFLEQGELLQYWAFFGLLAILIPAEAIFPGRAFAMERGRRWLPNFGLTLINIVAMGFLPVTFVGAAVWARSNGYGLLNRVELTTGLLVVVTLLLRGFISFFTHLLMHKLPLFWRVHRVHHLDTELDVSTTVRFHPLEFFIALLPGAPLVVLFGLTPWVLAAYEVLDVIVTLVSHANVRLPRRLESVLRYLVVTPELHRVHHSSSQPRTDSNYGAVFPFWDLLFGTFRSVPREESSSMELGLEEVRDRRTRNVWWLLVSPFLELDRPVAIGTTAERSAS